MKKYIFILPVLMLVLSGCITINTGGADSKTKNLGGIFKSNNKGETWVNSSAIATTGGKALNFVTLNVASMAIDPSDNKALYYGSIDNGLLYSYDAGVSWNLAKSLGQGTVESVAVDAKNKCNIYAARKNKIYKSTDCNRTWTQIYQDDDPLAVVNKVVVDYNNGNLVYAAISRGDLIKSDDGGNAWSQVNKFENRIARVVVSRRNSREIFVATYKAGVFRSNDGGNNWSKMETVDKVLKDNDMRYEFRDFDVIENDKGRSFYLATFYGLLKSTDNGASWKKIELVAPKDKMAINSMAVNPSNANEVYYTTNNTFYKSVDGGDSWKTLSLPTLRAGWNLMIDERDPNVIYMGVVEMQK